jgi:hypothetical protein
MKKTLISIFLISAISGCSQEHPQNIQSDNSQPIQEASPTATAESHQLEDVKAPTNITDALADYAPDMGDFSESNISKGAALFLVWAADSLKWSDLQKVDSGKYSLVMKDSSEQIGKKICATGSIIEISANTELPQKIFLGGLFDRNFHVYRFIAVNSTGELVQGSSAKFCGIITGKNDYGNSNGGVAHAIHLIGMFDLPENK